MDEKEFHFNPILYPLGVLGLVTGNIVESKFTDISWLPWVIYGFAGLMLLVAVLKHRTIVISENAIVIKAMIKGELTILKSEVAHYRTTYEYRKAPFTTWYFTMKSGKEIILVHDYMRNEQQLTEAVNVWCSTLPNEPSA